MCTRAKGSHEPLWARQGTPRWTRTKRVVPLAILPTGAHLHNSSNESNSKWARSPGRPRWTALRCPPRGGSERPTGGSPAGPSRTRPPARPVGNKKQRAGGCKRLEGLRVTAGRSGCSGRWTRDCALRTSQPCEHGPCMRHTHPTGTHRATLRVVLRQDGPKVVVGDVDPDAARGGVGAASAHSTLGHKGLWVHSAGGQTRLLCPKNPGERMAPRA